MSCGILLGSCSNLDIWSACEERLNEENRQVNLHTFANDSFLTSDVMVGMVCIFAAKVELNGGGPLGMGAQ